jgi:hypothetical protein
LEIIVNIEIPPYCFRVFSLAHTSKKQSISRILFTNALLFISFPGTPIPAQKIFKKICKNWKQQKGYPMLNSLFAHMPGRAAVCSAMSETNMNSAQPIQ